MSESNAAARPWIGSSSIAGILGLSPFSTPLQEYQKMVGEAPELAAADEAFFARRKSLEGYVQTVAEQHYGLRVTSQNVRYADQDNEFLRAEIDFEAEERDGTPVNGEIKTCHPLAAKEWGPDGSDEYPVYIAAQVQQGLLVRPKPRAVLIACIGFDTFRRYDVLPDPEIAAHLRTTAVDFWQNHVLTRVPPAPVSAEDVKRLYVFSKAKPIEATAEIAALIERHALLGGEIKVREEEVDELALQIKLFLAEHDALTHDGKVLATWRTSKSTRRFDAKALEAAQPDIYRQFVRETPGNRPLLNKLR